MKSKAIVVLLLIVLSLFLFAGCAESFTYLYYTDKSGAIHYDYILKYDAAAADAEEVKEKAIEIMEDFVRQKDLKSRSKISSSTPGKVVLSITFEDLTDRNIYYGQTGKEKPIVVDPEQTGIFYYYDSELYPYESVYSMVRDIAGEEMDAWPDPDEMYFVYGTTYSTDRTNADYVNKSDGIYFHSWKVDPSGSIRVVIRRYGLNGVYLFGAGILLFVLSLVVLFVIIYSANKRNRRKFSVRVPVDGAGAIPVNEETEETDDPFDLNKGDN